LGAAKTVSAGNGDLYELNVTAAGVIGDLGYVVGAEHSDPIPGIDSTHEQLGRLR